MNELISVAAVTWILRLLLTGITITGAVSVIVPTVRLYFTERRGARARKEWQSYSMRKAGAK